MRETQFGRIENLEVRQGQPFRGEATRVVRSTHLHQRSSEDQSSNEDDFELKQAVRDLLAELEQLNNGTVVRIEFRRGLPFLLETTRTTEV